MQGCIMLVESFPLNVGHNDQDQFGTLGVGRSWSFIRNMNPFPKDAAVGDNFRYGFKGVTLDWWDWGDWEDHKDVLFRFQRR